MAPTKILITEDEVLIAREIEATLEELGYGVVGIATDGNTALEKVAQTRPDLVLMDIVMPGELDGIATADLIRTRFQIPVVYLTAYADNDTLERAKISEPFGYVLKPFQPQELNIAIQIALVRHSTEKQKLDTLRRNISWSLPHEINTPLVGLLGFTDFLLKYYDSISKDELMEIIECMHSSAIRLEIVCHNFLLYTKLELLATDPQKIAQLKQQKSYTSDGLIESVSREKAALFERKEDLQLELSNLSAQISENYLAKIVAELADNAFKFSQPGTIVRVVSWVQQDQFSLSVSDRGRGMTPQQTANFGAYMQFERQRYEQQGLGLGIALVQRLVELHDGKLTIESQLGEGTTVTVQLPLAKNEMLIS